MRHRYPYLLALIGAFVLISATSGMAQTNHAVSMIGTSFSPPTLTIMAGDQVTWTNQSPIGHTSTSGTNCTSDGIWNSGLLGGGQTFTFTFNNPGTYPYYCIPHCLCCAMIGEITVLPQPDQCMLNCPAGDGGPIGGFGGGNKSPDLNGDTMVGLIDLSIFAQGYPPNAYDYCIDYNCDGVIGLVDLATFAIHFMHAGAAAGVCQ